MKCIVLGHNMLPQQHICALPLILLKGWNTILGDDPSFDVWIIVVESAE